MSNGLNSPGGLATDSSGDVFVAYSNNTVEEYSASGVLLNTLSNGIAGSYGFAADSRGDVFVGNQSSNTLEKFTPAFNPYSIVNANTKVTVTAAAITAPSVVTGSGQAFYAGSVNLITGLSITDAAAGSAQITVKLSDKSGLLNASAPGLTAGGENTNSLTLTGGLSAVNAALLSLTDTNTAAGADNIAVSVTDAGTKLTGGGSVIVNLSSPFSLSGFTTKISLSDTAVVQPFASLKLTDNLTNDQPSATIAFNADSGILSGAGISDFNFTSNNTITYSISAATPGVLQQELQGLSFTPTQSSGVAQTVGLTLNLLGGGAPVLTLSNATQSPAGVAVNGQGDIYVSYSNSLVNMVKQFSPSGALLATYSAGLQPVSSYYAQSNPFAVDSKGDVFVINSHNSIEEFAGNGALLRVLHTNLNNPTSLITDTLGDVYAISNGNGGAGSVIELSATGALLQTYAGNSAVIDALGNVYVGDNTNDVINEYASNGDLLNTLKIQNGSFSNFTIDKQGDVYAIQSTYNYNTGANVYSVVEYSAAGSVLATYATGLVDPVQLAVDSSGNLYIADAGTKTIQEYSGGLLLRTLYNGVTDPTSLAIDSHGDLVVGNQMGTSSSPGAVEMYAPSTPSTNYSNSSTQLTVLPTQSFNAGGLGTIASPDKLSAVYGDSITINDATGFNATAITAANVTAAGGVTTSLAGWISGALAVKGADLPSHDIGWFNFSGNTYLVEQAGAQGAAYAAGDTLVQLTGVLNESHAVFSGHSLIL